jgi:hypothetical protein
MWSRVCTLRDELTVDSFAIFGGLRPHWEEEQGWKKNRQVAIEAEPLVQCVPTQSMGTRMKEHGTRMVPTQSMGTRMKEHGDEDEGAWDEDEMCEWKGL